MLSLGAPAPWAMLRALLVALLYCCASLSASSSSFFPRLPSPAVSLAVSQKGMDFATDVLVDILLKKLELAVYLPDMNFEVSGFVGKISKLNCYSFQVGQAKLVADDGSGATGSATLSVTDFATTCSAHWSYHLKVWPHFPNGQGTLKGSAKVSCSVPVTVSATDRGQPHVSATDMSLSIDITKLDFSRGISGSIFQLFESMIKSDLAGALRPPMKNVFESLINDNANQALESFSVLTPLLFPAPYDISEIDFGLLSATSRGAEFAAPYVSVSLHGEAYRRGAHQEAPGVAPAVGLPPCDADLDTRMAQVLLHPFVVESLGSVFVAAGLAEISVNGDMIPPDVPIQLDTTSFSMFAPGLAEKYPDKPLEIVVDTPDKAPKFVVDHGALHATATATFTFNVVLDGAERALGFEVACPLVVDGKVSVTADGSAVTAELTLLECPLSLSRDETGGDIDVDGLDDTVAFLVTSVVLPMVNDNFKAGVPLPTIDGLSFHNFAIGLSRGDYLAVSSDLSYVPPGAARRSRGAEEGALSLWI